jgi:hypothetical protein
MRQRPTFIIPLFTLAAALCVIPAAGQQPPHLILPDQTSNYYQPFPLRQTPVYFEVDLLVNPVYIAQFNSKFRVNGQRLKIFKAYRPKFYGTQPFQKAFSSIGEIADQSNAAYASFYLTFLENSAIPFFHHIRLIAGALHEKLQTDSSNSINGDTMNYVNYRYYDGGTEATFMLEKNIAYRLSTRQYQDNGIIFSINAQAGVFGSVAKVRTAINYNGYNIMSTNHDRWQWPSTRNGWGWITGLNMEVGGLVCHDYFISENFSRDNCLGKALFWFFRRFGVTVASKLMVDGLNSADGVIAYGVPRVRDGSTARLRINNYSMFFTGPLINIKWMNLN